MKNIILGLVGIAFLGWIIYELLSNKKNNQEPISEVEESQNEIKIGGTSGTNTYTTIAGIEIVNEIMQ